MSRIVCIHSYREGTGKTTISANVAALLALRGQRVCLVDASFHHAAAHLYFGLTAQNLPLPFKQYLLRACPLEQTLIEVTPPGVKGRVFLARLGIASGESLREQAEGGTISLVNEGIDTLRDALALDVVLLDIPAGTAPNALALLAMADVLAVVMLLNKEDFQGTAVLLDVARRVDVPLTLLVINDVPLTFDADSVKDEAEEVYRCPVGAVLPHIPNTWGETGLIALDYPEEAIAIALNSLTSAILAQP